MPGAPNALESAVLTGLLEAGEEEHAAFDELSGEDLLAVIHAIAGRARLPPQLGGSSWHTARRRLRGPGCRAQA